MRAILQCNGKETEVELKVDISKEELQKLLGEKTDRSPFARREKGEKYYLIDTYGDILRENEGFAYDGGTLRAIANYCADKDLIQQQAYREILNRLLWRWQYENDVPVTWSKEKDVKNFKIVFDIETSVFDVDMNYLFNEGITYFSTKEKAEQAIKEVIKPFMIEHPDFVW